MNAMPEDVASATLETQEWDNSHLLTGDPMAAVRNPRQRTDGHLLVARSRTLVHPREGRPGRRAAPDGLPGRAGPGFRAVSEAPDATTLEPTIAAHPGAVVVLPTYRPDRDAG
jgi:hypothetical protein